VGLILAYRYQVNRDGFNSFSAQQVDNGFGGPKKSSFKLMWDEIEGLIKRQHRLALRLGMRNGRYNFQQ
jgi:hypothetical protein